MTRLFVFALVLTLAACAADPLDTAPDATAPVCESADAAPPPMACTDDDTTPTCCEACCNPTSTAHCCPVDLSACDWSGWGC